MITLVHLGVVDGRRLLVHPVLGPAPVGGPLLLQLVAEGAKHFVKWSPITEF